jgi:large subunit ribosomal protein L18
MRKLLSKAGTKSLKRRIRRKLSIRKKINGTAERLRICPNRTNSNIRVQVINDDLGTTLFSVQTFGKNAVKDSTNTIEGAKVLGKYLGEQLLNKGLKKAVFDRNGRPYHGVIKALADSIREAGVIL